MKEIERVYAIRIKNFEIVHSNIHFYVIFTLASSQNGKLISSTKNRQHVAIVPHLT